MGNEDKVAGQVWWEPEQRLGRFRLCVYRKSWPGAKWFQEVPTGWSVSQEDRLDGQWIAILYDRNKTVVGSKEDAMAFAEATYHLGNSVT